MKTEPKTIDTELTAIRPEKHITILRSIDRLENQIEILNSTLKRIKDEPCDAMPEEANNVSISLQMFLDDSPSKLDLLSSRLDSINAELLDVLF